LSKQLLRSGTSIGANIRETNRAQSEKDFVSKMNIALKEAAESEYWLELLCETNYLSKGEYSNIMADCGIESSAYLNRKNFKSQIIVHCAL